jgi:hypothetical protein
MENSSELLELSYTDQVGLVWVSGSCYYTGSIKDEPYWISRENRLELIEQPSINKVRLV